HLRSAGRGRWLTARARGTAGEGGGTPGGRRRDLANGVRARAPFTAANPPPPAVGRVAPAPRDRRCRALDPPAPHRLRAPLRLQLRRGDPLHEPRRGDARRGPQSRLLPEPVRAHLPDLPLPAAEVRDPVGLLPAGPRVDQPPVRLRSGPDLQERARAG